MIRLSKLIFLKRRVLLWLYVALYPWC